MSQEPPILHDLSLALREQSQERLTNAFVRFVRVETAHGSPDPRDTMIGLAPFLDCARRLGFDPAFVLGPVAAKLGPGWFQETFEAFVRRPDVNLAAFGWSLVETPAGASYRFEFPA